MSKTLNKTYILALASCLLFLSSVQVKAQGDDKARVPGYVFKTTSTCPSAAPTTANPASSPNAQGIIATDKVDVQIFPSCNQQSEVHISIDKNNPLHLVASANTMFPTYDQQGYYYSTDGGLTWSGGDIYPNSPTGTGMAGDPSTAFDANDNAFITTLKYSPQTPGFFDVSSANGVTWSYPAPYTSVISTANGNANNSFDKEMIAADNFINSPHINNIYCVGTELIFNTGCPNPTSYIDFFRSTDGGNTFSSSPTHLRNGGGFGNGANVQTGPNGEVFVCWADYGTTGTFPASNIGFTYSADAGNTWPFQTNTAFSTGTTGYNGGIQTVCNPQYIHDLDNTPFGGSNSVPCFFGCVDGTGHIRVNDFPAMAVDKGCSAKTNYNGRVYIAFPEIDPNGYGYAVIAVSYLDPPYNTTQWSVPTIVSIYPGGYPVSTNNPYGSTNPGGNPYNNATQSFFPWIAVDDATGIVSVVYYCFDDGGGVGAGNQPANFTNTYVAYSSDGGATFNNIKVSDVNHLTAVIPGYKVYAGDYIGITAHNGKAYAAWMDNRIQILASTGGTGYCTDYNSSLWQIYVSEIDYTPITVTATTPNVLNVAPANITGTMVYQAVQEVVVPMPAGIFQTASGSNVTIRACDEVRLTDGFSASNELHAYIDCTVPTCIGGSNSRLAANNTIGSPPTLEPSPIMLQTKLGTNIKLGIFPNPTSGMVYLNLSAQSAGALLVNITDVNGNQLLHNRFAANEGANSFKLDLSNLNSGVYFINITDENGVPIKNDKLVLMGQ